MLTDLAPDAADAQEAADDLIDAGLAVPWRTAEGEPAIKLTRKGVAVFFSDPETARRLQRFVVRRPH